LLTFGVLGHLLQAVLQREYYSDPFAFHGRGESLTLLLCRCVFLAMEEARTRDFMAGRSARSGRFRTRSRAATGQRRVDRTLNL
jgi:hypothetical protein